MFDNGRRLSRLEDSVTHIERILGELRADVAKLDPVALEDLRRKVLNTIRSIRRLNAAEEPEEAPGNGGEPQLKGGPWWARGGR